MASMIALYPYSPHCSSLDLMRHMSSKAKAQVSPADAPSAKLLFHCGDTDWVVQTQPGQQASVQSCNSVQDDEVCRSPTTEGVEITVAPDALKLILERRLSPLSALLQRKLTIEGDASLLRSKSLNYLWDLWQIPSAESEVAERGPVTNLAMSGLRALIKSGKRLLRRSIKAPHKIVRQAAFNIRQTVPRMAIGVRGACARCQSACVRSCGKMTRIIGTAIRIGGRRAGPRYQRA